MENTSLHVRETERLSRVSKLITAVSDHVRTVHLTRLKKPTWILLEEQVPGKIARWLHCKYRSPEDFEQVVPSAFGLIPGLYFALSFEPFYAAFFVSLPRAFPLSSPTSGAWGALLVVLVLALGSIVLAIYNAVGVYWVLFELVINRRLSLRTKLFTILFFVVAVGCWLYFGAPSSQQNPSLGSSTTTQAVADIRQTDLYHLIVAAFVYIPAISYGALWLSRTLIGAAVWGASALGWVFSFHSVRSAQDMSTFLVTPLHLDSEGESKTLLGLDRADLNLLSEWAICRRGVVQHKLVPTTVLLTALALLADTSLAEAFVHGVGRLLRRIFLNQPGSAEATGDWLQAASDGLAAYAQFFLLMALVLVPVVLVVRLLNELFVMDYIAQACVLAKHAKLVDEGLLEQGGTTIGPRASEAARLPGCLGGLSHSIAARILGGKE